MAFAGTPASLAAFALAFADTPASLTAFALAFAGTPASLAAFALAFAGVPQERYAPFWRYKTVASISKGTLAVTTCYQRHSL